VDREPLLYIPFSEGVYSKFPGRIKESSSRGGDAPFIRAGSSRTFVKKKSFLNIKLLLAKKI
jgi:hypothetical protein